MSKRKAKEIKTEGRKKKTYLWDGEHGDEIDDKIAFKIAHGNLMGIRDEFSPTEDPGAGCNEGDPELEDNLPQIEEIGESSKECDDDTDVKIDANAARAADEEEVEI